MVKRFSCWGGERVFCCYSKLAGLMNEACKGWRGNDAEREPICENGFIIFLCVFERFRHYEGGELNNCRSTIWKLSSHDIQGKPFAGSLDLRC